MKTFEEKWTAWLDGQLTGKELSDFEASLKDRSAAEAEKRDAQKLGALLKKELGAQALANAEFFSHQLRERIRHETGAQNSRSGRARWWSVPGMAWAGATSIAIFALFTFFVVREKTPDKPSPYLTQILNTRVDPVANPNATTAVFETKKDKVTVLWVEGLQSLPADYAAK
jgi:hypothetical protein